MTIVVSVRVTDGIVLAADSATTFSDKSGQAVKVYNNANKIFNLVKGWPIGAMTYGAGSIGRASIETLSKDLRAQLTSGEPGKLDRTTYQIEGVAHVAREFLEKTYRTTHPEGIPGFYMGYRVCGYSASAALPEAWEVRLFQDRSEGPDELYAPESFGIRWAGEREPLDRLILGVGSNAASVMQGWGLAEDVATKTVSDLMDGLRVQLFLAAMPIQDAIELARFLAETAAKFTQFSLGAATVGGPIEVATITKHEGFKWVARKHFFTATLNQGVPNG